MSIVAGRLLTLVREHDQHLLAALPSPARPHPGVTIPDPSRIEEWRATVRALASAIAECETALLSYQAAGLRGPLETSLTQLHSLAGMALDLLENSQLSK
jgi:hypothetical protein